MLILQSGIRYRQMMTKENNFPGHCSPCICFDTLCEGGYKEKSES